MLPRLADPQARWLDDWAGHTRSVPPASSGSFEELAQVRVDLILVRGGQAMGSAGIELQHRVPDQTCRELGGVVIGHDLVVLAVDDQRGASIVFKSSAKSVSENAAMQS